ncbi:MAG TPA: glycosyltransferase family 2 protein [Lentisphaeria bacterium]|nr:MAG: hypothetical protein A2X47_10385 [Lentisphaerae bacterium GWF2_38_69]HBM15045.1 glycosyltransferase family 2 protein [Lentisphaeria bacterium]
MKILVAIPVYNNVDNVGEVIQKVLRNKLDVLVINDGSTDGTDRILMSFNDIKVFTIQKNKGKGNALRTAFAMAAKENYTHIITIDADGQHNPEEIGKFVEAVKSSPDSITIGCRDFSHGKIPYKSTMGRMFSNLGFKIVTGINIADTQSGFRVYPLKNLCNISFTKDRYDFEMEILLKAAMVGIQIKDIPISVNYSDKSRKLSNFSPVADSFKIANLLLNNLLQRKH